MGKRKRASSSSLFLMELILAILFFCIAGTICISVFAKSHMMHKSAAALNNSVRMATDAAEIIRSSHSEEDISLTLKEIYKNSYLGDGLNQDLTIYLDNDFKDSSAPESPYRMVISPNREGRMLICLLSVYDSERDELLYELTVNKAL